MGCICTSLTTMSILCFARMSRALLPSAALSTEEPASCSVSDKASRRAPSSSTTRTFDGFITAPDLWFSVCFRINCDMTVPARLLCLIAAQLRAIGGRRRITQHEARAATRFRLDRHLPAMSFHHGPHHGETEARPCVVGGVFWLVVAFFDVVGDAGAVVGDADFTAAIRETPRLDAQHDLVARRLNRVGRDIEQRTQ